MGVYTRQQLVLLLLVAGAAGAGLGVAQWRAAHPEVVERLERIDREIAASADPAPDGHDVPSVTETAASRAETAASRAETAASRARGHREPDSRPPARTRAPKRTPPGPDDPVAPLDLNRATAGELIRLPGIGPVLAQRILDARDAVGRFAAVDDLVGVRGLGRGKLDRLRPYVGVLE